MDNYINVILFFIYFLKMVFLYKIINIILLLMTKYLYNNHKIIFIFFQETYNHKYHLIKYIIMKDYIFY